MGFDGAAGDAGAGVAGGLGGEVVGVGVDDDGAAKDGREGDECVDAFVVAMAVLVGDDVAEIA